MPSFPPLDISSPSARSANSVHDGNSAVEEVSVCSDIRGWRDGARDNAKLCLRQTPWETFSQSTCDNPKRVYAIVIASYQLIVNYRINPIHSQHTVRSICTGKKKAGRRFTYRTREWGSGSD